MKTTPIALTLVLTGLALCLAGCETVPYPERAAAYEAGMTARFVGKSSDELVLAFGPPQSSYVLSDGRNVLQYEFDRSSTRGGDTYTTYQHVQRARTITDNAGNTRVVQVTETIPVTNATPIYTVNQTCIRRFVVGQNHIVESFRWQGNSCF